LVSVVFSSVTVLSPLLVTHMWLPSNEIPVGPVPTGRGWPISVLSGWVQSRHCRQGSRCGCRRTRLRLL